MVMEYSHPKVSPNVGEYSSTEHMGRECLLTSPHRRAGPRARERQHLLDVFVAPGRFADGGLRQLHGRGHPARAKMLAVVVCRSTVFYCMYLYIYAHTGPHGQTPQLFLNLSKSITISTSCC